MNNVKMLLALILMSANYGCGSDILTGRPGANGHSAAFKLLSADTSVCPSGGSVMSAGVDLNDDGTLQPSETTSVLVACNGQQGATGAQGQTGSTGAMGSQGAVGTNGTDATPVTTVQLCPGVSNYGVFVEVGVCMSGKLYGVYSENGGFFTYLADGSYSSNGIGSACNLIIKGCTVTH